MFISPRIIETHNKRGQLVFIMIDSKNNLLYKSKPTNVKEIAKNVGTSTSSCYRAMKELHDNNVIINMKVSEK